MKKRSKLTLLALSTALLAAAPSSADLPQFGTFVSAKRISGANPRYPSSALMSFREGWVKASFCIDASGALHDPVIERSSGAKEFEREVLRALPRWKYEPAHLDGKPVEQCAVAVMLTFSFSRSPLGARPQFIRAWKEVQPLIEAKDFAAAEAKLDAIKTESNYESARIHFARSRIASLRGNPREQLDELGAALRFSHAIEKNLKADAKRQAFSLATSLSLWSDALSLYEELEADHADKLSEPEKRAGEQLQALVQSDKTIASEGELTCRCDKEAQPALWETRLLRREFGFASATGKIDRFELRCARHRFTAPFALDKNWRVPEAWGACRLYVFGDEGATVKLVEAPASVATEPALTREAKEQS